MTKKSCLILFVIGRPDEIELYSPKEVWSSDIVWLLAILP